MTYDGRKIEDAGVIGFASILVDEQGDPGLTAAVAVLKGSKAKCADCQKVFAITELDGSTALCELCFEVAGLENEVQDGVITEAEFDEQVAALGYEGSA